MLIIILIIIFIIELLPNPKLNQQPSIIARAIVFLILLSIAIVLNGLIHFFIM